MSQASALVHLFRELKAPAARALPKLAERARHSQDAPGGRARDPRLPGRSARHLQDCHRMGRPSGRPAAPGRLNAELKRLERYPLLIGDEVGYIPFDPQAANLMFMLVSRRYERASLIVPATSPSARLKDRDLGPPPQPNPDLPPQAFSATATAPAVAAVQPQRQPRRAR